MTTLSGDPTDVPASHDNGRCASARHTPDHGAPRRGIAGAGTDEQLGNAHRACRPEAVNLAPGAGNLLDVRSTHRCFQIAPGSGDLKRFGLDLAEDLAQALNRLQLPVLHDVRPVQVAYARTRIGRAKPFVLTAASPENLAPITRPWKRIEVVLVTRTLHSSPAGYGIVLALWGIGATLGSALVSRLRHLPLTGLLAGSFVIMAISYLGMGHRG